MASMSTDAKGRYRIQFVNAAGERKPIWLGQTPTGKPPKKWAESFLAHVEELATAQLLRLPFSRDLCIWLNDLPDKYYKKLVAVGLAPARMIKSKPVKQAETTGVGATTLSPTSLGGFADRYSLGRKGAVKLSTLNAYGICRAKLVAFFGESRELATITALDAEQFRDDCKAKGYAENYTRTLIKNAKLLFGAAVKGKLIAENPFKGHKTTILERRDRMEFVDIETSRKVLAACPTAEWRAIFALCRFGGLRCPSEVVTLRWDGIDWDRGRILVHSPKTEHHEGGESRLIPLWPELRDVLSELHLSPEGGEFVIKPRPQEARSNLRTTLLKIIAKAGVKPWQKPFQNLRSSRETELMNSHPIHVVTAWMGNTPAVAMKNYLQVRDEDFDKAVLGRFLGQHASVPDGGGSQTETPEMKDPLVSKETQGAANRRNTTSSPTRART